MAQNILQRIPQIQKPQPGYEPANCAVSGYVGKGWVFKEQGILVPKHGRPGRIANREANIHPQHDAQQKFNALKPFGDSLRGMLDGLLSDRSSAAFRSRRRCWADRERRGCRFRLL